MLFAGGKLDFLAAPPANSNCGSSGWNFNQAIPDANMELYSRNGTGANWNILLGFTHMEASWFIFGRDLPLPISSPSNTEKMTIMNHIFSLSFCCLFLHAQCLAKPASAETSIKTKISGSKELCIQL